MTKLRGAYLTIVDISYIFMDSFHMRIQIFLVRKFSCTLITFKDLIFTGFTVVLLRQVNTMDTQQMRSQILFLFELCITLITHFLFDFRMSILKMGFQTDICSKAFFSNMTRTGLFRTWMLTFLMIFLSLNRIKNFQTFVTFEWVIANMFVLNMSFCFICS